MRAAFAASVLLVLTGYLVWLPLANGAQPPSASWFLIWAFAIISGIGAVSILRGWRPGTYMAFGAASGAALIAVSGLAYLAAVLVSGTHMRGFSTTIALVDLGLPLVVSIALTGAAAWQIGKLLSARGSA